MILWPEYRANWDPFSELRTLQRQVNRLFEGYRPEDSAGVWPVVNLWSNGEEAVVTAEIPGVDTQDIDVTVVRNQLTIEGERKVETPDEGVVCHRAERISGRFVRTLRLPFEVEDDRIAAQYRQGVLTITLPRSEATKPKKVAISAS